ncbi:MAG: division/cell wall cluster transcriptional repressor MraZ [Bacteroidota bacterium]
MFIGSFTYSIDAKNRISIPAKLRRYVSPEANDTFFMTRSTTAKCIDLYPMDQWMKLVQRLEGLNQFDSKEAKFLRMYLEKATDDKMDSQSRLLLPVNLLEFAGIKKEVFVLGAIKKIELWNPDIYRAYAEEPPDTFEQIAQEVMRI